MATAWIKNVKISALCCAVPTDKLTYEDFYKKLDKDIVNRFVKDTGVKQKFFSKNRKTITSDLCFAAAEEIFQKQGIDKNSIDAIVFVTQTPDFVSPNTASTLQYRLGLSEDCIAYDVNQGCSGYVYGLYLASTMVSAGGVKRVLLLVGDTQDSTVASTNLNDLLFGDCGSATIVDFSDEPAYKDGFRFMFQTIGSGFKDIGAIYGLRYAYAGYPQPSEGASMNGLAVFTFSITKVPELLKQFFNKFKTSVDEYSSIFLHQANKTILNLIAKKIKVDPQKVPLSLDKYGNTASATIANVICDYYATGGGCEGIFKPQKVLLSGFGIGLSIAICDTYLNPNCILPIIHTDITWDEGRIKLSGENR